MARNELKAKIRLEGDAKGATAAIKKTESAFKRLGNSIKANALKIGAALGSIVIAFRLMKDSADLEGTRAALELNLAAQGVAFDKFIAKLKEVSDSQVSTAQLIQSSSKALLLGIPAEEIAQLLEIAKASSIATGQSVAKAFDDIATGIGRASPMILDNLGIIVKLGPAYEAMADSLGKSVGELTAAEQKQALLNEVLAVGAKRVELFGDAQTDLVRKINQGEAAFANFKTVVGQLAGAIALSLTAVIIDSVRWTSLLVEGLIKLGKVTLGLAASIPGLGVKVQGLVDTFAAWDDSIDDLQDKMKTMSTQLSEAGDIAFKAALGFDAEDKATKALSKALDSMAGAHGAATDAVKTTDEAVGDLTGSFDDAAEGADTAAGAMRDFGSNAADSVRDIEALTRANNALAASIAAAQAASQAFDPTRGAGSTLSGAQDALFPGLGGSAGGGVFTVLTPLDTKVVQQPNGRIEVIPT